jgi:hypothetical protein
VAFGTITTLHLFFDLPLDKACPGGFDPRHGWQDIFAAPSCRRRRSPAGSG